MITYINSIINNLPQKNHKVILTIEFNEAFTSSEGENLKLVKYTFIVDPIFNKHSTEIEPNIYKRDSMQI